MAAGVAYGTPGSSNPVRQVRALGRGHRFGRYAAEPGTPLVAASVASLAIAARWGGVVPQHPPMMVAPASSMADAAVAMMSGSDR
jgi:hypothetical protein